jgi:hypothetical protein
MSCFRYIHLHDVHFCAVNISNRYVFGVYNVEHAKWFDDILNSKYHKYYPHARPIHSSIKTPSSPSPPSTPQD